MNICFAALSYRPDGEQGSGVGSQVRVLAHGLVAAGHSVGVVSLAKDPTITDDLGVQIDYVSSGTLHWFVSRVPLVGKLFALPLREIEYSIAAWRGVRRANKTRKIDLIEGTETGMLLVAFLFRKIPVIIRLHGEQYTFHKYTPGMGLTAAVFLSRLLQRFALRRAKLLISPSQAHAEEISRELRLEHPRIRVVPNCFDVAEVSSGQNYHREENTVLFVGRLERVKGVPILLEAARQVVKECPTAHFILAGTSHPTLAPEEIDAMIRRYSLDEHIERRGFLGRRELIDAYRQASVCVMPSHYESFGLVALEAGACGVPVVGTRVGGLAEVIEHGNTGLLVDSGDASGLAAALIQVLTNPSDRKRMGKAAQKRAETKFSSAQSIALNLCLYEEMQTRLSVSDQDQLIATFVARANSEAN